MTAPTVIIFSASPGGVIFFHEPAPEFPSSTEYYLYEVSTKELGDNVNYIKLELKNDEIIYCPMLGKTKIIYNPIENVEVTNVTLDQKELSINVGQSKTLVKKLAPLYADEQLTWSSRQAGHSPLRFSRFPHWLQSTPLYQILSCPCQVHDAAGIRLLRNRHTLQAFFCVSQQVIRYCVPLVFPVNGYDFIAVGEILHIILPAVNIGKG